MKKTFLAKTQKSLGLRLKQIKKEKSKIKEMIGKTSLDLTNKLIYN